MKIQINIKDKVDERLRVRMREKEDVQLLVLFAVDC